MTFFSTNIKKIVSYLEVDLLLVDSNENEEVMLLPSSKESNQGN